MGAVFRKALRDDFVKSDAAKGDLGTSLFRIKKNNRKAGNIPALRFCIDK
jgi:hypothetical protein